MNIKFILNLDLDMKIEDKLSDILNKTENILQYTQYNIMTEYGTYKLNNIINNSDTLIISYKFISNQEITDIKYLSDITFNTLNNPFFDIFQDAVTASIKDLLPEYKKSAYITNLREMIHVIDNINRESNIPEEIQLKMNIADL